MLFRHRMKKTIGNILCILAAVRIASFFTMPQKDSQEHQIQDWALVGVLLAVGIGLSNSKETEPS
jgi:hypothetical protein